MKVQGSWIRLLALLAVAATLPAVVNARAEQTKGRVYLVGADFSGWRGNTGDWQIAGDAIVNPSNERLLSSKPGSGVIINGPTGRTTNLLSKAEFGDVRAHVEFMVPKGSNSGVYFMGRYEIQILDSWSVASPKFSDCGGIYQRWDNNRTPKGFEGHPPRVNASRPPGQWQSFDVIFRAPRFDRRGNKVAKARFEKVIHNGVVVHEDVELSGPTRASVFDDEQPRGPLMLQGDHGPVAYRNIWLEPAGPNPFFALDTATKDAKHRSAKAQVSMVKELGYAGIAPSAGKGLAEMAEEAWKNGLTVVAAYVGTYIGPGQREYGPELTEALEILKGTNSMLWLFIRSKTYKPSSPQGDREAVELVREVADMAAEKNVRVALYPHAGFWLERLEDAIRVAKKAERKNVGVTFNLCHWLKVDDRRDPEPLIKMAMPYLFVVTINGADADGKDWKSLIQTLDRGTFDVRGFLRTLADCGYTGPVGFQGYGIGGDAYDNLKRTMDAWKKLSRVFLTDN